MPFTLAHPAAVLPLRRYCPRFFDFRALVIGSVVPDLAYCFKQSRLDEFAHRWTGSIGFCLPVGVIVFVLLTFCCAPFVRILPVRYRAGLLSLCQRPIGSRLVILISLLVGTWTHLLLDSMTHKYGGIVEHVSVLRIPLAAIGRHTVEVHFVLWYAFTFLGVAWLCFAYQSWRSSMNSSGLRTSFARKLFNAILFGSLILPIAVIHHTVHGVLGASLVALGSALLILAVMWRTG